MYQKLKHFLTQPYPFDLTLKKRAYNTIITSVFIVLFLALFQPFGIQNWHIPNKMIVLSGYGIITLVVALFFEFTIVYTWPNIYNEDTWNIGTEILYTFIMITCIGVVNYLYTAYISSDPFRFNSLLTFQFWTFIVAFLPLSFLTVVKQNRLLSKNLKIARSINEKIKRSSDMPGEKTVEQSIFLYSDSKTEKIKINLSHIRYLKSVENYVEITWFDTTLKKNILRNTLTRMNDHISEFPFLFKCHRKYIVNIKSLKKVSGNSQGLKLQLNNVPGVIPVSRNYVKKFQNIVIHHPEALAFHP